jgi:DamX protein
VELSWHEIRLVPFSRDEVRRYLRYRFEEAGWDDHLPFTELQIQELIVDSRGYPGEIDRLASGLLSGNGGNASSGLFPPMHRAVLMLAGVVVGMVWLVWQFGELTQGPEGQSMVDRVARGNQRLDQGIVQAADPVLESESIEFEPASDVEPPSVDLAFIERESVELEPVEREYIEPQSTLVAESESVFEPEPEPLGVADEPEPTAEPDALVVGLVPGPDPALEPEAAPVAPPVAPPVVASGPVEPVAEPAVPAATQSQSKPQADSAVDARERFNEPEPAGPKLRPGANGAGWLMRQAPERYTLQLFGTSNLERMVAYVNRQEDISEFALLTLDRDGEPWYVVTYGLFSTPGAARDAAENLPGSTGRIDPWVRKVESVQAHIQQAR